MAFRLYIVPVIGDGSRLDPRRPKYFTNGTVQAIYSAVDYGFEPWMIVGADLSASDDTTLVGEADAFALPFDLTANLTAGQVTSVQNKLEAINIPADWVSTSLTWAQVVRIVLGMCMFVQRLTAILTISNNGVMTRLFNGITLATQINQLPQAVVDALTQAAADLNLSTSGITGTTTLRVGLKTLADRFGSLIYRFGSVEI